jgi:hypothetical protein
LVLLGGVEFKSLIAPTATTRRKKRITNLVTKALNRLLTPALESIQYLLTCLLALSWGVVTKEVVEEA